MANKKKILREFSACGISKQGHRYKYWVNFWLDGKTESIESMAYFSDPISALKALQMNLINEKGFYQKGSIERG